MMIIHDKNKSILSVFHFSTYIFILFVYYFLIQLYFESNELNEINSSINKRLADYEETFLYLEQMHNNASSLSPEDLLSNTTLYLNSKKLMHFGSIELKNVPEKNNQNYTYSRNYLKNTIRKVILSKAFIDLSVITEPLVEIQFPFYSQNGDFLYFSTVVLLQDILCYYDKIAVISMHNSKKGEPDSYFLPSLGISVKPKDTPKKLAISISFLIISLLYLSIYMFFKYQLTHKKLSHYIKENNRIKKNNIEMHNANELLKEIDCFSVDKADQPIEPVNIIKKFLKIYENDILEKNLRFFFSEDSTPNAKVKGSKHSWHIFLGSILEILIKESPPGSSLSYSVKTTKNGDTEIYYLVFNDGFFIKSKLEEKLTSEHYYYKCIPKHNMERLLEKMNIFVNFSFCESLGNTISIAYFTNKHIKISEDSNVILFGR